MNNQQLEKRVRSCAGELVSEKGYVAPVDLLVKMGRLTPKQVEDWRFKRIPYIEKVTVGNLSKVNKILQLLERFAKDSNLKPSTTHYKKWGKGRKETLRFSKSGNPHLEKKYSTHYLLRN